MLRKNIGFDQLSIMGDGITGTVNGQTHNNIQAVMAHRCRLESFEETEYRGKKYWDATFSCLKIRRAMGRIFSFRKSGSTRCGRKGSSSGSTIIATSIRGVSITLGPAR